MHTSPRGIAPVFLAVIIIIVVAVAGVAAYVALSGGSSSTSSSTATQSSSSTAPAGTTTTASTSTVSSSSSSSVPSTSTSASTSTTQSMTTTSSSTSAVTTYSSFTCTSTYSTSSSPTVDRTAQYIATVKQFSAMEFRISGTYNGTASNSTLSYLVTSSSGGIYTVNFTEGAAGQTIVASFVLDSNNDTVLSVNYFGQTLPGSEAKSLFDGEMALFGLEYTYGGALGLYTSSSYFHSTGTASMTFGQTSFQVTTYVANNVPETINDCGVSSTINAYTLGVGTPPGLSLQFITYLHVAGTNSNGASYDDTFQLVSMTVA
jgi:hypothetical protein